MAEIAVLTCPVCDRSAGFPVGSDSEGLQDVSWDHLATHRLDESKRAIYAVMMVERSERRSLAAESAPTGEWTEGPVTQPAS